MQDPVCGWCSIDSPEMSGIGVCVKGTLEGPRIGDCDLADFSAILQPSSAAVDSASISLQRAKEQARYGLRSTYTVRHIYEMSCGKISRINPIFVVRQIHAVRHKFN
jgi:hypothetical protein